jgi:Zn-dependent peptidase ImmA (M78 family)
MSKMGMALKSVALGAGSIAILLDSWIQERFVLPQLDLPDFGRDMGPEAAAQALRLHWGLGETPIKNMTHLLESKGVRVYSLAIDAREVDAFSTWWNCRAFVFLNTQKSAEHSRFDAAHELGHLVLHRHGAANGQDAEKEANAFASAFLMPLNSILATQLRFPTLDALIRIKKHWGVSVAALNYRLHSAGLTTEWINRNLCIQIATAGYRTAEPQSMSRETSQILEKVFRGLREEGIGKSVVARDLCVNLQEIEELTYGLLKLGAVPERNASVSGGNGELPGQPTLSIVK